MLSSLQRALLSKCLVIRHLATQSELRTIQDLAAPVVELEVKTPWGHLAVKDWGPKDGSPIVGIHGWQTNAAIFDRLVPLLPADIRFVAPDYSGHGRSSHRPLGSFYGLMEFVTDIHRVVEHMKLEKFTIMTHSFGFIILTLYNLLYPERIKGIISLDFGTPEYYCSSKLYPQYVLDYLNDERKAERRNEAPPSHTMDEAVKIFLASAQGTLTEESAKIIVGRGLVPVQGTDRFVFSRDPRIKNCRVLGRPYFPDVDAAMKKYNKDMLMILSDDKLISFGKDPKHVYRNIYGQNCRLFRFVQAGGNHYVHLNEPERVAGHVTDFLLAVKELDKKSEK